MTASSARDLLVELYRAAIEGADVRAVTANAVAAIPMERRRRVWLFSFGKAARPMAEAAVGALQRELSEITGGVVVAPDAASEPSGPVALLSGDHPIPGRRSFDAAARIAQTITQKRGTDLGIVLLSGGASSLIAAPIRGMSESDLARLYELLLRSGLDIHEMNAVRKRFALWAAGRMALALAPARTYCFAVSDVPGDDLATIASGPCVPDPVRVDGIVESLERVDLLGKIPASFHQYLAEVQRGIIPDTPKATHPAFAHVSARVIANNTLALNGAAAAARRASAAVVVSDQPLAGEAAEAGVRIADSLATVRNSAQPGTTVCCLWGGETTVRLGLSSAKGGRCQELALAAAQQLATLGDRASGVSVLAAGTDGRDGDTDAAGAFCDATTWAAIGEAGRDPGADLREHRSHDALAAAHSLFSPGVTGTNVSDIVIGLVRV